MPDSHHELELEIGHLVVEQGDVGYLDLVVVGDVSNGDRALNHPEVAKCFYFHGDDVNDTTNIVL